jgi:cytochrome P450
MSSSRRGNQHLIHIGEDLISGLIRAGEDGDRLSPDELRMLVGALLTAGTDTTRNQLAAAIDVFCDHPDQWVLLAEHPELAPQAVDEVMRYTPVVLGARRIAVEDIELAGVAIPVGTSVTAFTAGRIGCGAISGDPAPRGAGACGRS